ncbi:DUF3549 family protein [Aestuariibacter sp. AA17]|uniref:DUF3549 family protein n=1 Tax=Fluctibacter corallii TaxID=2984329 RepID=A0ABT3A9M2_9ALTE|nr:DUF3549 family protein [Aestuariibacter sp. AA17]MCV2884977.1 DUF3549 family protein [Aestuariibacter sp. AA17]
MSQISTISEFLLQAGTEYRIFDMGRGIRKVPAQTFLDIENGTKAPAFPRLQHAWYGITFWNKQLSSQHFIWFVKLPLDEQGLLIQAARNQFLQLIVEALGRELEQAESKNGQLPENPYSFVPTQHQLADFNSISRKQLGLPSSEYFAQALGYVQSPDSVPWQSLPIQGLADFAARIDDDEHTVLLKQRFGDIADEVKLPLLTSLENQAVTIQLAELVQQWLSAHPTHSLYWQHGLRALSQSVCTGLVESLLDSALNNEELYKTPAILIIIAGRQWQHLQSPERLKQFLLRVAEYEETTNEGLFAGIYADLVQIPELRSAVLNVLRDPHKPDVLAKAVGKLFSGQG